MTVSTTTCAVCSVTFERSRKDKLTCSPTCKETAKKRRQRSVPEKASRELNAKRVRYWKRTAADLFDFSPRIGYEGEIIAPVIRRARSGTDVDDVFDHDDDPAYWVSTSSPPLSSSTPAEFNFGWIGAPESPLGRRFSAL